MTTYRGRVAFITGGASGAGFGQALVFGLSGARIAIADVRADAVAEAVTSLRDQGVEAFGVELDVTDRAAYARAVDAVEAHFGAPVTLLFNTAGINAFGPVERMTFADFDRILAVNLSGVINGLVTLVPRMIEAGLGGHVVAVASVGGFEGGRTTAPYSAAKAAVINLMESYAQALPDYGIGVTVLCPASIRSNIAESHREHLAAAGASGVIADDGFIDALAEIYASGMAPETLALHLKASMEAGDLYCIPYPEVRGQLESCFGRILDAIPDGDEHDARAAASRAAALEVFRERVRARPQPANES